MTQKATARVLDSVLKGQILPDAEARSLVDCTDLSTLLTTATQLRDQVHQNRISYSRKVFIPLTQLCRDVCHYCTFAQPPRHLHRNDQDDVITHWVSSSVAWDAPDPS